MLKFIKKDAYNDKSKYYLKKIMPQVRELWVDKEVMNMLGIKNVQDVFTINNIDSACDKMTEEELKICCTKTIKMVYTIMDAMDEASDKLHNYFQKKPEAQKYFEAPTLLKKRDDNYVIEYVKSAIANAVASKDGIEYYEEKMKTMDKKELEGLVKRFFFDMREREDSFCNFLSMGVDTVKLEQMAENLVKTL